MTACVVSTQLGSIVSPRGQVCVLLFMFVFIAAANDFVETKQSQSLSHVMTRKIFLPDFKCHTSGVTDGACCAVELTQK